MVQLGHLTTCIVEKHFKQLVGKVGLDFSYVLVNAKMLTTLKVE